MNLLLALSFVLASGFTSCAQNEKSSQKTLIADMTDITNVKTDTATLGAGCFWCVEAVFQQLDGVLKVTSGYTGGHVKNPTYEEVCAKNTGHVEVAQVVYDPSK